MATAAKQAKTEEKNGAETADEQAGKLLYFIAYFSDIVCIILSLRLMLVCCFSM